MPSTSETSVQLTLTSESMDHLILQTYLTLLSEQDPKVRLQAARDLATIRGHFAGKHSSQSSSPTQINQFVATPEQLAGLMGGFRLLTGQNGS